MHNVQHNNATVNNSFNIFYFYLVVFVKEEEIALTTIKTIEDPRTLDKALIFRPPGNTLSFNEIVSIWESKIGKTLERTYVSEEQLLKNIKGKLKEMTL